MFCGSGSTVSVERDEDNLHFEIQGSAQPPYQSLSFGEYVSVAVQECSVIDGEQRDLSQLFSAPTKLKLHNVSRALAIAGAGGELHSTVKRAPLDADGQAQFILEQLAENVDFTTARYRRTGTSKRSSVDSIHVRGKFPIENRSFVSRAPGDLEVTPEPNRFVIYDLSESGNGLRLRAQGKLNSLKVGQEEVYEELVPGYITLITKHPTVTLLITWLGWLVTVLVPFVVNYFLKRKNLRGDE